MKKLLLTTVAMATVSINCFASSESTSICELELQQINETGKKPKTYVSSCYFHFEGETRHSKGVDQCEVYAKTIAEKHNFTFEACE